MKHLKETIIESYSYNNLTPRAKRFFAELQRNGLEYDGDATGLIFVKSPDSPWELAIEIAADYFDFYLGVDDKMRIKVSDPEREEEKLISVKELECSHDHPKNIDGEPCFDYSKKNAKILADALNAVK